MKGDKLRKGRWGDARSGEEWRDGKREKVQSSMCLNIARDGASDRKL